ncbi:MAG: CRISPR-associated endonuclease Cas2 [Campylobacteraceae bacterium]|jgi:CRISPR-associated protein Cas2|nr:CRISPR-associated endonuclease Cas2 [Campylobacteraceae bacterium]
MLVVSYDISNDKLRSRFSKTLERYGGIRLQYSVFEVNNSKRVMDTLKIKIENIFAKQFGGEDSIFIFETDEKKAVKYGNAIHRDQELLFFT